MRTTIVTLAFALASTEALAQASDKAASQSSRPHVIIASPSGIAWGPAPAILPPGAKAAILEGNPAEPGDFTLRLALPANYRIPPHFHPVTEHVTVVSGEFFVGMGERFDATKATELQAGTFAALAPGMRHYAYTKQETIIQLHGVGPWSLVYVNPADDPRTKAKP